MFVLGAVMPPITLFAITITPGVPVPAEIPRKSVAAPVSFIVLLPVAAPLPMVFPAILPQLRLPVTNPIPCCEELVLDVVREMF